MNLLLPLALLRLGWPLATGVAASLCLSLGPLAAVAQTSRTITGTITDEQGEGLPRVTVLQKGTTNGQGSGPDGTYSLMVPASGATLVFSSIGFVQQEVAVSNQNTLNIKLVADVKVLNDVVVVGYSAQRKDDLTGSVASADLKAFRNAPNPNITQSLQGSVPGPAL